MSRQIWRGTLCLLCAVLSYPAMNAFAQPEARDSTYYENLARNAYKEKNYGVFLESMKRAVELRPNHPRLMYNLAAAYALNGEAGDAVAWLRKTAAMGLIFSPAGDDDFASLKNSPEFKSVLEEFERNKLPRVRSVTAFTVPEKDLVPESVAYDARDQVFYLSSVYKRKIISVGKSGKARVFAGESDDLWSVMGMKVDRKRRLLWVCTTAHQQMSNFRAEDKGKAALLKYDLTTGRLLARFQPKDTAAHWLGDLVINSQGDVFTTDSVSPVIYIMRHNGNELEPFLTGPPFVSLQGLDFTRNQKQLFVADYAKGIFLVDLETKKVTPITAATTLLGIDGLYAYKDSLICIQNGVNPNRVIRLSLSKNLTHVERFETIEANNPLFDEPTLGVVVKDDFYFVANSQWGAIDQTGHLKSIESMKDPTILKLKL